MDPDSHMVPRSHISSRLCESGGSNAPGRNWIDSSDPAYSGLLDDFLSVFHRRLPTRPLRLSLRSSCTRWWPCHSHWKRVGSLQTDGDERLENVQDHEPISFPAISGNDNSRGSESLGKQFHESSHAPKNLTHYHVRNSLRPHHTQHQVEEKPVGHDPIRGLTHQLRVLHLQANLLLPGGLIAGQGRLMLEVVDRGLRCQISCNQSGLYATAICGHDHSGSIANRHNSIRIGPGKRSVDRKAITDHGGLVSTCQSFRGYRVLLDEPGEEIPYLPISPDIWFPDPDSNVCSPVSLRNNPSISARRVPWVHVHLCNILFDVEVCHQILYVRGNCIGTRVGSFRKASSLRGFTRITVRGNDNVSVNRFFACRSDPAPLIIREIVGLDADVDIRTMALGNLSEVTFEDMPIEYVGRKWKFKLVPSRAYHTNRTTCCVDRFRGCVDDIEILDSWDKFFHFSFDRKIFAATNRCAKNFFLLENLHFQALL